jgi:2-polyprenyl-3-methyl-5-hydroxy-6-metoxy-1,4-benzoquinol methylase
MRAEDILNLVVGPEVLDIGCAGHQVTPERRNWLHGRLRERFEVTGIDISEKNVAILRSLGFDRIFVENAENFDLGKRFNTIVAGEVIEHLSNTGRFFAAARRHLLPGGRLVLSTPYVFSLMYAFYALHHFPKTCENAEHTCWLCPRTIAELARREQMKVTGFHLVSDYDPEVTSRKYRIYWTLVRTLGKLLPKKLTMTNMIVVLQHSPEGQ